MGQAVAPLQRSGTKTVLDRNSHSSGNQTQSGATPDLPETGIPYGLIRLEQSGDFTRAEAGYREAIRWQPDFAAAHDHLANLLAAQGDAEQARYERSRGQRR